MRIAFRVDASDRMGMGHLVRCRTLAETLRGRGTEVHFICRNHPGNMISDLRGNAIPVTALPAPEEYIATGEDYDLWRGVTQAKDAEQSSIALRGQCVDWLVVDHYGLDAEWERAVRPHVGRSMVIDDLANRPHECDLLLDQNFSLDGGSRYLDLVPSECPLLLGPKYALLHPEYAAHRHRMLSRDGQMRRIVIFLGGTDPNNVTSAALDALSATELADIEVDVVVGPNNPHRECIAQQAAERPHTHLHGPRPHLADLMAKADLAIGAGGITTWERLCLGVPSLVVSIADNQRPTCEALQQAEVIRYLGHIQQFNSKKLQADLMELATKPQQLRAFSAKGAAFVDGMGAERIAEVLVPSPVKQLRIRPARPDDVTLYFSWVNDPAVRAQSVNTAPVAWESHAHWFAEKLADPGTGLYVLEANELAVGQIRFHHEQDSAVIGYSLDPLVRGRGWGSELVIKGINEFRKTHRISIRADVKATNPASSKVFEGLGFQRQRSVGNVTSYILPLNKSIS